MRARARLQVRAELLAISGVPKPILRNLNRPVPTLTRFILRFTAVALVAYTAMFALANFVEPTQREIVTAVPLHPTLERPASASRAASAVTGLEQTRNARLVSILENLRFPVR
jgi:hypothetical protein